MPPFSGVVGDRGAAPAAGRAWGARQPARGNKSLQHLTKMARRWVSQGLQRCNSPIPANCGTPGHLMIARSTASEIPPTHPSGIIPEHPGSSRKGGPLLLQVCGRSFNVSLMFALQVCGRSSRGLPRTSFVSMWRMYGCMYACMYGSMYAIHGCIHACIHASIHTPPHSPGRGFVGYFGVLCELKFPFPKFSANFV